jgi:prolyl-tRNA editing enzyme YbaK/EbsC (Cys-tRNA(Pro) deacylase)
MTEPQSLSVSAVESSLRDKGIVPKTRWFDDGVATAQQAADALGVEIGAIANSLVFTLDGDVILILASGAHRVDTEWLGKRLGGTIARAKPAEVKDATGQVIGGVAPLGHPAPIRTIIDEALAVYPEIWASAGHPHAVFATTYDELARITGATPSAVDAG